MGHLHLYEHQVKVISMPPDRPNIFLEVVHKKSYDFEEDLMWVVEGVKNQKEKYPKTLIFAQTVSQVSDIYEFCEQLWGTMPIQLKDEIITIGCCLCIMDKLQKLCKSTL